MGVNAEKFLQGARWSADNERIAFFAGAVAGGIYYFAPLDEKGTNTLFLYEFAHINS
jgi:hypothetical protein